MWTLLAKRSSEAFECGRGQPHSKTCRPYNAHPNRRSLLQWAPFRLSSRVGFSFLFGVAPWLACVFSLCGQDAGEEIRLTGIVSFSTNELALLEVNKPSLRRQSDSMILAAGQREEDVEVLRIDLRAGSATIRRSNEVKELNLNKRNESGTTSQVSSSGQNSGWLAEPASIRLRQTRRDQLFTLYQMLVGRSLIRSSALPAFALDLDFTDRMNIGDVVHGMEQALAAKGVFLQPDGDKFVIAGREGEAARITSDVRQSAIQLALPWHSDATNRTERGGASNNPPPPGEEVLPAGVINFPGTDLNQVLQIFQELVNRTVIRPATLPSPIISFRTYTPLSRREVIYAFVACFSVNGISVLPCGEKFVLVFAAAEKEKAAALLAQKQPDANTAQQKVIAAGIGLSGAGVPELVSLYEKLSGQSVQFDPALRAPRLSLRTQTALTPAEARYALDLLLGFNGLAVVPQEAGSGLQLMRAAVPGPR